LNFQEVISHEYGIWAAAQYLKTWLSQFAEKATGETQSEAFFIQKSLELLLQGGLQSSEQSFHLRQVIDQAVYLANLHDSACCQMRPFRQWVKQCPELAVRVNYTLAIIDLVLDEFVWSLTMEMQELRSLRKSLLANWSMLRDLRELSGKAAEEAENLDSLSQNVERVMERCRTLLATYGET
jgi:hypothetical protein